ncbi:MAG: NYN domain-containing protein, partial [Firmicutes bacterium]|nr:NYN domain-containing protein [Bacillota bacterium]
EELKTLAADNIESARNALIEILANYQGFQKCEVILVFDAYKVKQNPGSVVKHGGLYVVYTKEAETADAYIEKTTYELGKKHHVRVATSDRLEQMIILGHGAVRVSAREFHDEIERVKGRIATLIQINNDTNRESNKLKHRATIVTDQK